MGKYRAYSQYKDSGVEWLPPLPAGWRVERGKYVFKEVNERSVDGSETLLSVSEYYGVKPRAEVLDSGDHLTRAESLEGYKRCKENDLVMNIMLAWKRGLGVTKYDGIVSPAYSVFRFEDNLDPDFMHYLLRTDMYTGAFKCKSTGVIDSRLRLYPESFGTVEIIKPSLEEQSQIAAFLDRETAKIDQLIAKQEALIGLLKEKRQAVISHAVTKGLDPDVPMKDSGVEWLGEIPAHWEVKRIKHFTKDFEQGWSPQCDAVVPDQDEWGVLKVGCVNGGTFNPTESKRLPRDLSPRKEYLVKAGDLLISRANTRELLGSAAVVKEDSPNLMLCDKLYRLRLFSDVLPSWVSYILGTRDARGQIEVASTGASHSMQNIGQGTIKELPCPVPPRSEQEAIVKYLKETTKEFDTVVEKCKHQCVLLQERRTALISAAVTGKIDVRKEQA